jgi:hypothetical protein
MSENINITNHCRIITDTIENQVSRFFPLKIAPEQPTCYNPYSQKYKHKQDSGYGYCPEKDLYLDNFRILYNQDSYQA